MKLRNSLLCTLVSAALIPLCGLTTTVHGKFQGSFIVTSAPAYEPLAALRGGERFARGARLLVVRDGVAEPLIPEFAESADASVAFDAKAVLFSGKKSHGDPWQIWEFTLADRSLRQVTSGSVEALRPLYLPGRRVVFARRSAQGNFTLAAADLDGKNETTLSYVAANAVPADVLADGRILFESGFPLGSGTTPELYLVYSDGSGVESYRCDHPATKGTGRWGGRQLASGNIVFTHGASLARFRSALAGEERIPAPAADYAGGIVETDSGAWLLSARTTAGADYAVSLWNPPADDGEIAAGKSLMSVLVRAGENLVDPVLLAPRIRPHQHPSALHDWNDANLLALDARLSRQGALPTTPAQIRVETRDAAGRALELGTAPVEPDGSFFVKTPADQPIRFALLDSKGAVLRQEHGWFWMRRGEQRICIGCHTGPERASENRVPAVLLRSTTPTDLSVVPATSLGGSQGGH